MRKYAFIALACTLTLALASILYICFNSHDAFSCKSQYDLTEEINENILRSQGLLSAELSNHRLLINLEGLLTSNGDKYIVSRTIVLNLKKTTTADHLFYISDAQITLHSGDNTPENIAQKNLFSDQTNDRIIYINRVNDDTILFGNQTFPQYGCQSQKNNH
ncbi:hypothetical protein [Klebsiella michiganensis]|uniref:hypothetical protein n=1 Tax=Klebsiella michiganensis TaxID=1134687 RepID=UPI003D957D5F